MPAARRQSSKKSLLRCLFVKMKGLGIEFGRKSLNLRLGDAQSTGAEGLPHCEIFEVSLAHSNELLPAVTHRKARVAVSFVRSPSRPNIRWSPTLSPRQRVFQQRMPYLAILRRKQISI